MRLALRTLDAAALGAGVLLASPASSARADDRADVALRWSAPEGCPDEAHVRAAVERIAGQPLRSPGALRVRVQIDAAPSEGSGWTVRIAIEREGDDAPHERRIEGPTCAEVAGAAAVAVAVALTGEAAPRRLPPPPPPTVAPEPEGHDQTAPPASKLGVGLRIQGGPDAGSLPAPAFGVQLAAALLSGKDRVELRGSAWLPRTAGTADDAMAGARLSLYEGGVRYCRAFVLGAIEIGGCGGVEVGALVGSSYGVTRPRSAASPWVAPGLGALGAWAISPRLSLAIGLEGLVPVVRNTFQITGLGDVFRPPPVTGRALLGLETRFR